MSRFDVEKGITVKISQWYRWKSGNVNLCPLDEQVSQLWLLNWFQNPDTCFSDQGLCSAKGMTLMSLLKLNQSSLRKTSSYIMSSGGQSTKGRGFAVLHFSNKYIVILSTKNKQWKLDTPVLPTGWFNFAFTWRETGQLKLYVNGTRVASGKPSLVSRPQDLSTSWSTEQFR